jgi:hypothetical protein
MAADIEVHIDFAAGLKRVGTLHRHARRGAETTSFEYHPDWLADDARFSLEPALILNRGAFAPAGGTAVFGAIGDSAPDTWGRRLMQRAERRRADRSGRAQPHRTEPFAPGHRKDSLRRGNRRGPANDLRAGLLLAQNPDDLLFREPARLHGPSPSKVMDSTHFWRRFRGSGQPL